MSELPAGTVTFLFTDIEGSTRLLRQLGAVRYGEVLADQRAILRAAFEGHGGREIDTQGDAFFVSFLRARDAVAAVVEVQRALVANEWPEGVELRVRMGLHTGEPLVAEEGYVGMDVHRAARIAHISHGGQVLLSVTAAELARGELPEGTDLLDLGVYKLKDIQRGERIHQLQIAGLDSTFPPLHAKQVQPPVASGIKKHPSLPAFLKEDAPETPGDSPVFVARERELEKLDRYLEQAIAGHGQVVLVSGEPGRGKTALLQTFATRAMDRHPGLLVAAGQCNAFTGTGDPYLPFRDILSMLTGELETPWATGSITTPHARRIWQAIPEVVQAISESGTDLVDVLIPGRPLLSRAEVVPDASPWLLPLVEIVEGKQQVNLTLDQTSLFGQVEQVLRVVAENHPLLLTLDDLQWADTASLNLLFHLGRRLTGTRIMILGDYRPEEVTLGRDGDRHPLEKILGEFKRQFGDVLIELEDEDASAGRIFVDELLNTEPNRLSEDFRQALYGQTHGHPLFTIELLRGLQQLGYLMQDDQGYWIESSDLNWSRLPARVEGVIDEMIARLPDDLRDLLAVGSVQGETFFTEVIAQVRETGPRDLTIQLSRELDRRHRLIREQGVRQIGSRRLSGFQFRHILFQKYIYQQLTSGERMYLHEAVGNALETLFNDAADPDDIPSVELARHFQEAQLGVKASRYLLLAGRKAVHLIAYDEAAAHFEHGLFLLANEKQTPKKDRLVFDLSFALAMAYWHGGHIADANSGFKKAIGLARELADPELLATAVLAYEQTHLWLDLGAEASQPYILEAMAALGEEESPLRVRLLVFLSRSLLATGEQDGLRPMVDQALDIARRIDDPVALFDALRIRVQIDRRPEAAPARLADLEELITIAKAIGDQERLADAFVLYIFDHLEMGHIDRVNQAIKAHQEVAEAIKQPFQLHASAVYQTMKAILRGDFIEAERFANQAADLSHEIGLAELDGIFGIHMFTIRWEQGRLGEIAPLVKLVVAQNPESATWRPGLALIYRTLGMRDECKAIFEDLASGSFGFVPQDSLRVATLAYLTEICSFLKDADRAERLYDLLSPYQDRTVVVGGATACYGAVGRYLGMLAMTRSRYEVAEEHFRDALELDSHIEAWPWLAHSQCEYAAMLLKRGGTGDRGRAQSLLGEAANAAQRMGMGYLEQKVADLQARHEIT